MPPFFPHGPFDPVMSPEADAFRRQPPGMPHGFPNAGYLASNLGLEPGRGNPFWPGGPAGGQSLSPRDVQTPEEHADLWSPLDRTSVVGRSYDLDPAQSEELVRAFMKSEIGGRGICLHWAMRPTSGMFNPLTDTFNARIEITFGAGGAQMVPIVADVGCGSLANDGADVPEPTGSGGFGGSIIVPGRFVRAQVTNTGTSPTNNRTTFAMMASIADTARNPEPVYCTQRTTLAAAGAAGSTVTVGIPPYSCGLLIYRTNSGVCGLTVQVLRYVGGVAATMDFVVAAGAQMQEIVLPSGSARVSIANNGGVATSANAMFRLNV